MIRLHPIGAFRLLMAVALCVSAGAILPAVPAAAQQAKTAGAPIEANKALIRRFIEEVHNKGNFALFNELFAPNYVNHSAPAKQNDRAAREQESRAIALPPRICVSPSTT